MQIHSKVSAGMFAGSVVAVVLAMLKARYNVDLSGQEVNLTVIVTAAAGYFMPSDDAPVLAAPAPAEAPKVA